MDTCPFLGGLIPLFWTSGDVSSGFQSQSGFCLIWTLRRHKWCTFPEIHLWCDTSAGVYSQHSSQSFSPHVCFSRGRMPDLNHRPPAWQADALTTRPQWPGFHYNSSLDNYFVQSISELLSKHGTIEFSLNVFTEFAESVIKIFVIIVKGLKPAISCIRDQDASKTPARHMCETWSLNTPHFMLQWFIRFTEFAEFTEFPFNLRKTPLT